MAHAESHTHHITSIKTLTIVIVSLAILTILTVVASRLELGAMNVPVAIGIAVVKASLVVLFFMALKWDNRVNALVFVVGLIFVGVFLTLTLFDTNYRGDTPGTQKHTIMDQQHSEQLETNH